MIEINLLQNIIEDPDSIWMQCTSKIKIENINFRCSAVRIDGVVYTECSEEFIKAFEQAMIILKLQD